MIRTVRVRLYPNSMMKKHLNDLCDYRRYCWNLGLEIWNDMYDESKIMHDKRLRPSAYKVRNELVNNKADWQYKLSARCLQLAIADLGKAWQNFLDKAQPDWGKPQFKPKKAPRQGFKTDRAKIINNRLRLDKPHRIKEWTDIPMKGISHTKGTLKTVSIYRENGKYWASLPFEIKSLPAKDKTNHKDAVDINVGHFNHLGKTINVYPKKLQMLYERIKHYQWMLARKREVNGKNACKSNNYAVVRAKLQRDYRKVSNIQHDIIQKFTTQLVNGNQTIVIEDLDVKEMQMNHVASKGLQRSLFAYFRQVLTYKCDWYKRKLVLADRHYPSTQRCSKCGHVKKGTDKITLAGNRKHHTNHNEYVCYVCGARMNRDENAVQNLLQLA